MFFIGDHNTQKIMTSNKTLLAVAIADLIISEDLSFNLAQNPLFKKVIYLEIYEAKGYKHTTMNLISKYLMDINNYQNMESNLIFINE